MSTLAFQPVFFAHTLPGLKKESESPTKACWEKVESACSERLVSLKIYFTSHPTPGGLCPPSGKDLLIGLSGRCHQILLPGSSSSHLFGWAEQR